MDNVEQAQTRVVLTKRADNQTTWSDSPDVARATVSSGNDPQELIYDAAVEFTLTGNEGAYFLDEDGQKTTRTIKKTDVLGICDVSIYSAKSGMVTLGAKLVDTSISAKPSLTFNFKLGVRKTLIKGNPSASGAMYYWYAGPRWVTQRDYVSTCTYKDSVSSVFSLIYVDDDIVKIRDSDGKYLIADNERLMRTGADLEAASEFHISVEDDDLITLQVEKALVYPGYGATTTIGNASWRTLFCTEPGPHLVVAEAKFVFVDPDA